MADLYLHLVFARRLRFAEGLHPLASEVLARRPSLVALGATLASLPAAERRGMSFLRRLFSRSGEVARWQKLLSATPGSPRAELIANVAGAEPGGLGGLSRAGLALGLLSYELLESAVGGHTAGMQPAERAAVERAQARLWLQATLAREQDLAHELLPVIALGNGDATGRALLHANGALAKLHGAGPGEALLQRWVRSLITEVAQLVEKNALPPSLGVDDQAARGPHFESPALVEKVQGTVNSFVLVADRLAAAMSGADPDAAALAAALDGLRAPAWTQGGIDELRDAWRTWLKGARRAALERGRNDKPAFLDGELPPEGRQRGITTVMSLADLPPEAQDVGAPPLPEMSGPNAPPSLPPTTTQEVSLAQIEADARTFSAPPHTQEVSTAQIEAEAGEFAAPARTQEVTAAQIESSTAPPARSPTETQPISLADIVREQAIAVGAAGGSTAPPPHDNGAPKASEQPAPAASELAADAPEGAPAPHAAPEGAPAPQAGAQAEERPPPEAPAPPETPVRRE